MKRALPKLIFVVGTRPEVIKMAPLVHAAKAQGFPHQLIALRQHTTLLDIALRDFSLSAKQVTIERPAGDLPGFISKALPALSDILIKARPDWVVVQGDTVSTFVGALAASLGGFRVCHLEAGIRTYNRFEPFPEETLRQQITRMASLHCAPTEEAVKNLHLEKAQGIIRLTGNTIVDTIHKMLGKTAKKTNQVFATIHRREHSDRELGQIFQALDLFAGDFPDWTLLVPLHPNPRVQNAARDNLKSRPNLKVIDPLPYRKAIQTIAQSAFIVTDSGGIQEEAAFLGVPTVVCRQTTERVESVRNGNAVLAGSNTDAVYSVLELLARDKPLRNTMSVKLQDPGLGEASKKILFAIKEAGDMKELLMPVADAA